MFQTWLVQQIDSRIRPRRLGCAFTELRETFAGLSRVPDVSVYRWDRIPRDAEGRVVDDFLEPPDIAIEIASPGQRVSALLHRCQTFVANGVQAAVLINPADESVWVVRVAREPVPLGRGETLDLSDIIPDLRLEISALFDALNV